MLADIATAVTLSAAASGLCTIADRGNHVALYNNNAMLVTTGAARNYVISSFQLNQKSFLFTHTKS